MTAIDRAAIAWTIGIVAVLVGIASIGGNMQSDSMSAGPSMETVQQQQEEREQAIEQQMSPVADLAERQQAMEEEEAMMEEPEEAMMEEPEEAMMEEPEEAMSTGPKTVTVILPEGTSVPGCEETNACFVPESVSINVGDTVSWDNVDTAAHTVTSGAPADGPDGMFDSSLLMGGATFEVTFDDSGSYDYFCMVHPWMIGDVTVS